MRKIFFVAIWFWASGVFAQGEAAGSNWVFGFHAGLETHLLQAGNARAPRAGEPSIAFQQAAAGLGLGVFGRRHLVGNLSLRPQVAFSYARHWAELSADGTPGERIFYTFADLEVPLHLVLRSPVGRLPLRSVMLFGGRLGLNVADPGPAEGVALWRERVALDLGLGVEFRVKNWHFQPEVVYSHGLNNLHNDAGSPYDRAVDRILRDKISLKICFLIE